MITQAIMRHQMEVRKQKLENTPKASFIFLIPASKYYLEKDNHDQVGLLQTMLVRLDETLQDSYQLEELWFKVCSNRELLFSLLSYKNLNDLQMFKHFRKLVATPESFATLVKHYRRHNHQFEKGYYD